MPTSSILFTPTIDERELDKEVGTVNDRLESVGEDIGVSFDRGYGRGSAGRGRCGHWRRWR